MAKMPPGPAPGELPPEVHGDPLQLLAHLAATYGDIVRCPSPYGVSYLLNHPDYARHFLHAPGWVRTRLLEIAIGQSSLSADGPVWRRRRRIVQPAFERARILGFGSAMVEETRALAERWAYASGPIAVDQAMMELTLRIVVRALFSTEVDNHVSAISSALTTVLSDLGSLTSTLFSVPTTFSPERNRRLKGALGALHEVVLELLRERRAAPKGSFPDDLFTRLLEARDPETGEALDDIQLRDELVTMLVAGHDTTATGLGWAWYLLSLHPEVEAAWHGELDARFCGRDPTAEDLAEPSLTRRIWQETLRLYPPVWAVARRVSEPDELFGYEIEGPSAAFISPYLLHRHREFWPNPDRFDPDRFLVSEPHRYAYLPFLRGPHTCAGQHFALLEGQLILAALGRRFRLRLAAGQVVEPSPLITLRMKNGLSMEIERRD